MTATKKFFSGNSVEQAVLQAARHFRIEPEELAYRQVERKHGFLRARRRIVIAVDEAQPVLAAAQEAASSSPSASAAEPATAESAAPDVIAIDITTGEADIGGRKQEFLSDASAEEAPSKEAPEPQGPTSEELVSEAAENDGADSVMSRDVDWDWSAESAAEEGSAESSSRAEAESEVVRQAEQAAEPGRTPSEPAEPAEPAERAEPVEPAGPRGRSAAGRDDIDVWETISRQDAVEAAEEGLRRLLCLGDLELAAEIQTTADGLEIELSGESEDLLFEDRGRLLLAIQHLLPRTIRGLTGVSVSCRVDSDNFHEIRAEQLRVLAQDAAAEVRHERRTRLLEPMSPDERRIIHVTLADDPAVETESQGSGLFKRVAIRPLRRLRR